MNVEDEQQTQPEPQQPIYTRGPPPNLMGNPARIYPPGMAPMPQHKIPGFYPPSSLFDTFT